MGQAFQFGQQLVYLFIPEKSRIDTVVFVEQTTEFISEVYVSITVDSHRSLDCGVGLALDKLRQGADGGRAHAHAGITVKAPSSSKSPAVAASRFTRKRKAAAVYTRNISWGEWHTSSITRANRS